MSNTLKAIIAITQNFDKKLDNILFATNRANSVGEGLEMLKYQIQITHQI